MNKKYELLFSIIGFFILINLLFISKIYAQETFDNRIVIKYVHSRRIPHQQIICTLYKRYNGSCIMQIQTIAMTYQETNWNLDDENTRRHVESEEYINSQIQLRNRIEEFAKENINQIIDIEEEFFTKISKEIWNIDLLKLIQENNNNSIGMDGSTIIIEYGLLQYSLSINVWNPRNTRGEVEKVNAIAVEIFKRANVEQWYQ